LPGLGFKPMISG